MLFQPLLRWGLTRYKEEYRWDVKNKGLKWKPGGKSVLYPSGPSSRSLTRFPQHEATKIITTPPPPLTPTGWDARPSQGYPKLPWQFAGSPFFLLGGDRHSESKVFSHARNVRCEISPLLEICSRNRLKSHSMLFQFRVFMESKKRCFSAFLACSAPMASCTSSSRLWTKTRQRNFRPARARWTRFNRVLSSEYIVVVAVKAQL